MIQIRLIKPLKGVIVRYEAELLARTATSVVVRAPWELGVVNMDLLTFAPGDMLHEHFYSDRWYNVFDLRGPDGRRKGWYCNITRPAIIADGYVESEDLELDLLVSADRDLIRLDDEAEFAARDLERLDPPAHAAALAAVQELRALAARGAGPFDTDQ